VYTGSMPIIVHRRPTHRACRWCASEFVVAVRPGRPRLYCRQACRQRAYEHRHGFTLERTPRPLPGQYAGETWSGSGYEQGGWSSSRHRLHALRTSVRPEGRRRETLCGVLAAPAPGRHFSVRHPQSCASCARLVESTPLSHGINPSNELALVRALIDEADERRIPVDDWVGWLRATSNRRSAR
jgi:hypothetical protein